MPLRLGGRHGGDDGTKCRDLPPRSDRPRAHNQLGVVARVRGRGAQFEGRLLESETYVGGHVECLQTGIYRNDLPVKFRLVPEAPQGLGLGLGSG